MKKIAIYTLALLALACSGTPAKADYDLHPWQVRGRLIDVAPQESSSGSIAGSASIRNKVMPELDISYFFNDHVSAELILATTKHSVSWTGGLDLGSVWVLPPTLTAQYHFMPEEKISPYVGAGLNYTFFYNSNPGQFSKISYDNGLGYALQAGVDYKLDNHWMLNLDVKKIYLNTNVSINNGFVTADVDLNPWVFGAGVGYRF